MMLCSSLMMFATSLQNTLPASNCTATVMAGKTNKSKTGSANWSPHFKIGLAKSSAAFLTSLQLQVGGSASAGVGGVTQSAADSRVTAMSLRNRRGFHMVTLIPAVEFLFSRREHLVCQR